LHPSVIVAEAHADIPMVQMRRRLFDAQEGEGVKMQPGMSRGARAPRAPFSAPRGKHPDTQGDPHPS
jgi:hypothetical protein